MERLSAKIPIHPQVQCAVEILKGWDEKRRSSESMMQHCCWPLILKIFNLGFIGSVGFDDHLIDSSLASILSASANLDGGCSDCVYQQIVRNMQNKFISIHKPPASIRFAPIKYALAVTVEPFKFSPTEPVVYELS